MNDTAFLSVRVPEKTKRLIKETAASKGMSIQSLVRELLDDLIEQEARAEPSLAEIINQIREHKNNLLQFGVKHVDLFGSIVRNEAGRHSDIDIAVEFKKPRDLSLHQFATLQGVFENILSRKVDLSERRTLKPEVKREFDRDAIRVF